MALFWEGYTTSQCSHITIALGRLRYSVSSRATILSGARPPQQQRQITRGENTQVQAKTCATIQIPSSTPTQHQESRRIFLDCSEGDTAYSCKSLPEKMRECRPRAGAKRHQECHQIFFSGDCPGHKRHQRSEPVGFSTFMHQSNSIMQGPPIAADRQPIAMPAADWLPGVKLWTDLHLGARRGGAKSGCSTSFSLEVC